MALFQVIAPKCSQYSQAGPQLEAMRTHISGLKATHALGTKVEGAFDYTIHRQLVANTPPRAIALLTFDEVNYDALLF